MVLRSSDLNYSRQQLSNLFTENVSSPASISACSSSSSSFLKRALSCATSWDGAVTTVTSREEPESDTPSRKRPNKPQEKTSLPSITTLPTASLGNSCDSEESFAMREDDQKQDKRLRALVDRLKEFHKSGLLTHQDYTRYRQLLQKYQSDYYIRQIHKNLDQIENPSPRNNTPSLEANENDKSTSNRVSGDTDSSNKERQDSNKVILEPHDLWSGNSSFDETQLQDIFVEMCFFARLGYVQPPCCLKCTYQQTMLQEKAKVCTRWVVWRKDAAELLHPNRLDGNIMIVQCSTAKQLLKGQTIAGHTWDAEHKRVVSA